jgi:hypothetical protein
MNQKIKTMRDKNNFEGFLKQDNPKQRILHLGAGSFALNPFDMEQLFLLPFSSAEKIALIDSCSSINESFLIRLIQQEDQDVAVMALLKWCTDTPGHLFEDLITLAGQKVLPQRLRYRLLDELKYTGGRRIIESILKTLQFEDLSHATRALLVQRCFEWGYADDRVSLIAVRTLFELFKEEASYPKDLIGLIYYIRAYATDAYTQMKDSPHVPHLIRDVLNRMDTGIWQRSLGKSTDIKLSSPKEDEKLWQDTIAYPVNELKKAIDKSKDSKNLYQILAHRLDDYVPEKPKLRSLPSKPTPLNDYLQFLEETDDTTTLSTASRQQPWVYQCFYLRKLGSLQGSDHARLRVLEYATTSDPLMLHEVIRALAAINTSHAHQELIHLLTRSNMDSELQALIVTELESKNLHAVQEQLRATIRDLRPQDRHIIELQERLSQLIILDPTTSNSEPSSDSQVQEGDLDSFLQHNISCLTGLSTEVRRALKTAAFVHLNRSRANMDLSPVVDMQYKALELFFREHFEERCVALIKSGVLQTKLDLMGYARPIEQQMNRFENYIQGLPVICDIPFFSRFKMRKFLRSICQYRAGKRFGFDGLKAYALFFLCFSRHEDNHGLKDIYPLGFSTDLELFQYCHDLHTLQDIRNRAAHEGLAPNHPTEAIWEKTARLLALSLEITDKNLKTRNLHSA